MLARIVSSETFPNDIEASLVSICSRGGGVGTAPLNPVKMAAEAQWDDLIFVQQ
jgi:hypothetical protein